MDRDEILTLEQAAEILKITPKQVLELCRTRTAMRMANPFPVIRVHRRCLRVKKSALLQWVDSIAGQS